MSGWAPRAGDLIWIEPDDTAGAEQRGRRPGLVISDEDHNASTGRAVVLPVTNRVRGGPFEVDLPIETRISGVVLCDQIRTFDWRASFAKPAGTVPLEVLEDARAKVAALIGLS